MAKIFDPQIINPILTGFIEELITTKGNIVASKPFEIAAKPIDGYDELMIVKAADKFDAVIHTRIFNSQNRLPKTVSTSSREAAK